MATPVVVPFSATRKAPFALPIAKALWETRRIQSWFNLNPEAQKFLPLTHSSQLWHVSLLCRRLSMQNASWVISPAATLFPRGIFALFESLKAKETRECRT